MKKDNKYEELIIEREKIEVLRADLEGQLERLRKKDEVAALEIDSVYTALEGLYKESVVMIYKLSV